MQRILLILVGSLLVFAPSALGAADAVTLRNCQLSLDADVRVPAQEAGVLLKIPVREGQHVAKDDFLAQIDDVMPRMRCEIAKYKLQVAQKQASDDIEYRYAKAAAEVARVKLEKSLQANRDHPRTISDVEVNEQRLERDRFILGIEKAQKDLEVARLQTKVSDAELKAAAADVEHRQLLAPLDGLVVELRRHEGEWVQAGDTVMRLFRLDVLRVEGKLNVRDYRPFDVQDRPVTVVVALAGSQTETFPGKIVFVSPRVVPGGDYQVRAEVRNRRQNGAWVLSPGMSAEMTIQLK
jgi:multidrug efflux pump subunit AcrA (membrane-fusion protein)